MKAQLYDAQVYESSQKGESNTDYQPLIDGKETELRRIDEESNVPNLKGVLIGMTSGLTIQAVTLGAYAYMIKRFGLHADPKDEADWFIFIILTLFSQIDMALYFIVWSCFTCILTKTGLMLYRKKFDQEARYTGRYLFHVGLSFLSGLILGSFMAWCTVDIYLGLPVPLTPFVVTVFVDLLMCYVMIRCYTCGQIDKFQEEEWEEGECC
jgi:hypothetical protein